MQDNKSGVNGKKKLTKGTQRKTHGKNSLTLCRKS